jgi:hypothetical protein
MSRTDLGVGHSTTVLAMWDSSIVIGTTYCDLEVIMKPKKSIS